MMQVEQLNKFFSNKQILKDINFSVQSGEALGIIGPNGSGKTTLLSLLSGVEKIDSGSVSFQGKNLKKYSGKELAKSVAVLQQEALPAIGFTVRQVVEMGRFPFQDWFGNEKEDSKQFVDHVLEKMSLTSFADRELNQLSGGERQRVALAKIMVQEPTLIMLDEPTTYLDIGHQIHLMDQIRAWQKETNLTVISVLHDLNLAALYCERLLLLDQGEIVKIGTPEEIIQADLIEQVYGTYPVILEHPIAKVPQIILQGKEANFKEFSK